MPVLLQLDSSADVVRSRSRAVTAAFAEGWRSRGAEYTVVQRDLHQQPIPHISDFGVHWTPQVRPDYSTPDPADLTLQEELLAELLAADALVVGVPVYNYSMPSALKAWVDHIHVPGVTSSVPELPLSGRPAVLVRSSGGAFDPGTPSAFWDHATPPLTIILGSSLGMSIDVITTSYTLADVIPDLAALAERADAELAAAVTRARELGSTI